MTSAAPARAFEPRHVQLARAAFAAIAAVMITFSPDHSAAVGLSVFSGFATATALIMALSAWLVFPAGRRWAVVLLAVLDMAAGLIAGIGPWRSTTTFFVLVISWAVVTGLVEIAGAWRERRLDADASASRDGLTVGILTVVFGIALLFVSPQYALEYTLEEAGTFTLTGITIAVGVFGGYAAIVAVYLGIAGLSPRRRPEPVAEIADRPTGEVDA